MIPAFVSRLPLLVTVMAILCTACPAFAQDQQSTSFYDVRLTKDDVYSYANLKFTGDYASFESPKGVLVLGKTDAGVTVVIILGPGTCTIEAPDAVQEKFKTVFNGYPLKASFKNLYIRVNPKEYEETLGKQPLTKVSDEGALNNAKELYDERFTGSFHAGPKALLPPYKTRILEFTTAEHGLVSTQEGYWLTLRKYSPYGTVYPSSFVNPKQK